MKLSRTMQKSLVDELAYVVSKMKATGDLHEKLYFFSGAYAAAQRTMNIEFDPELTLVHQVLNVTYNSINARLAAITAGQERGINIPSQLFDRLEDAVEDLGTKIGQGEKTYEVLERLSTLAFSTSGNGYYLYLKGMLAI